MKVFKGTWNRINTHLETYVKVEGDHPDIVLQKKIWWLLNLGSVPVLLMSVLFMGTRLGILVFYANLVFLSCLIAPLILFHFHRRNIERYALFSQLAIVVLTSLKVYLMGGMLHTGTPVYVGFIAPIYALILPNKKRAIGIFFLFTGLMITATLLNPYTPSDHLFYKYFLGFLISGTSMFFALYYFTTQWELSKKREKEQLQKLDDLKTRFYTHIAHEFRTPLTLISGIADQIREAPEQWLEEGHEIIQRNSRNLLRLTNQLLDLSRLEDHSMPVSMVQDDIVFYLRYLVESFHSMAEARHIRLFFNAGPESLIMDFDPDKIRDVVSNLLGNALKFTPGEGSVWVSVQEVLKGNVHQIHLRVRDTGVGISRGELPRIFNRYFQAKNHLDSNDVGSGLGLALTRELVHHMGGAISVESRLGRGSVFEVTLPITREAPSVSLPLEKGILSSTGAVIPHGENEDSQPKRETGLRLLIVEDNPDVVRYLKTLLESEYRITVATNGVEGLKKAQEEVPDLVISDVMMPVMDGFTLCRKLKADIRTSHIPIVLLTARADTDSRLQGLGTGADAYLSKPFDRYELQIRINQLIVLRNQLQERYRKAVPGEGLAATSGDVATKEDVFIQRVRKILDSHMDEEEFGIAALCETLSMSRSQLYRKFAALTDTTVNQYLQNLRLEKALELLQTTDLNVSEVAYDTGFTNPSHFSRAFSNKYGYAPSKARRRDPVFQ